MYTFMDSSTDVKDLAYDLRDKYAKIVGNHMDLVADARINQNFYQWFKALENLKTQTFFKFSKNKESFLKGYNERVEDISKLARKYESTWIGTNKLDPEATISLDAALRNLEEFIYEYMEKAKMFGEAWQSRGL